MPHALAYFSCARIGIVWASRPRKYGKRMPTRAQIRSGIRFSLTCLGLAAQNSRGKKYANVCTGFFSEQPLRLCVRKHAVAYPFPLLVWDARPRKVKGKVCQCVPPHALAYFSCARIGISFSPTCLGIAAQTSRGKSIPMRAQSRIGMCGNRGPYK